jgi:hypothetical protein
VEWIGSRSSPQLGTADMKRDGSNMGTVPGPGRGTRGPGRWTEERAASGSNSLSRVESSSLVCADGVNPHLPIAVAKADRGLDLPGATTLSVHSFGAESSLDFFPLFSVSQADEIA